MGGGVLSGESPPPGQVEALSTGAVERGAPTGEGLEAPRPGGGPPRSAEGTLPEEQASPSGTGTGGRGRKAARKAEVGTSEQFTGRLLHKVIRIAES